MKLNPAQFSKAYVGLIREKLKDAPPRGDAIELDDTPLDLSDRYGQMLAYEGMLPLSVGTDEDYEKPEIRGLLVRNASLALSAAGIGSTAAALAVEAARAMITPEMEKAIVEDSHQEKLIEDPIYSDPEMARDAETWFEDIKRAAGRPEMKVFVVQGDSDNAACVGDNVYVNAGLVFQGKERTQATMAHEAGHSIHKDYLIPVAWEAMLESWSQFPQRQFVVLSHESEFRADKTQMELMAKLGLNPEPDIMRIADTEQGPLHPDGAERAERMREHFYFLEG